MSGIDKLAEEPTGTSLTVNLKFTGFSSLRVCILQ